MTTQEEKINRLMRKLQTAMRKSKDIQSELLAMTRIAEIYQEIIDRKGGITITDADIKHIEDAIKSIK